MEALGDLRYFTIFSRLNSYKHLKDLKLWKVRAGDEGVKYVCLYLEKSKCVEKLDLLDNELSIPGKIIFLNTSL
jgi:hypothetical protein